MVHASFIHLILFNTIYYGIQFIFDTIYYGILTNLTFRRVETLGALWGTVRCYLLWRVWRDHILMNLPRRHTVSTFSEVNMGSSLAVKVII